MENSHYPELHKVLESIRKKLGSEASDPQSYLEILYELAITLERSGFPSDAEDLYAFCLNTSLTKKTAPRIAFLSTLHLSNLYAARANWPLSEKYYEQAKTQIEQLPGELKSEYYYDLILAKSSNLLHAGRLEEAYKVLSTSLKELKTSTGKHNPLLGHLLSQYGTTLSFLDQREEAIKVLLEALEYLANFPESYALTLANLGLAYLEEGNLEMAHLHLQKAESLAKEHTLKYALGYIQMNWGLYWIKVQEFGKAEHATQEAVGILKVNHDYFGMYFAKITLGIALIKGGKRNEGEKLLRKVTEECETYGLALQKAEALEAIYETLGDKSVLEEAEQIYRSLGNTTRADKIRRMMEGD